MGKGLGKQQSELLKLLENAQETHEGAPIVRIAEAIALTGMHQSAVSRAIKSLENRKIVKLVLIGSFTKDSVTLPLAKSSKSMTLSYSKQLGKTVKAYTWFDADLLKENWTLSAETHRNKDEHEQVLLALQRLRKVNFVFEKVYKEVRKLDSQFAYSQFKTYPSTSSQSPIGSYEGLAIPLRYISLESKLKMHRLKRVLKELEEVGYLTLVYYTDLLSRKDFQKIIAVC